MTFNKQQIKIYYNNILTYHDDDFIIVNSIKTFIKDATKWELYESLLETEKEEFKDYVKVN